MNLSPFSPHYSAPLEHGYLKYCFYLHQRVFQLLSQQLKVIWNILRGKEKSLYFYIVLLTVSFFFLLQRSFCVCGVCMCAHVYKCLWRPQVNVSCLSLLLSNLLSQGL